MPVELSPDESFFPLTYRDLTLGGERTVPRGLKSDREGVSGEPACLEARPVIGDCFYGLCRLLYISKCSLRPCQAA